MIIADIDVLRQALLFSATVNNAIRQVRVVIHTIL
jgi:superfamily II DNA/RNA helicase